jgi:predicted nicotinamide N-methyase
LARFFEYNAEGLIRGKSCLELGCGTGLVSLVVAFMGGHVVATDIPDCLSEDTFPNVQRNLSRYGAESNELEGSIEVKELIWGSTPLSEFGSSWDVVFASDVIYRSEHVAVLLKTLRFVVGPTTVAYVAFDKRGREGVESFLRQLRGPDSGFQMREVTAAEMPTGFRFVHFGLVEMKKSILLLPPAQATATQTP